MVDLNSGRDPENHDGMRQIDTERVNYYALLFSSSVGDITFPVFNIFLPLLAFQLGASAFEIGLVGGAANAMYSFMPLVMGILSDKIRKRHIFVVASFGLLAVVSVLDSFFPTPANLVVFRLIEGIAWAMLYPTLQAGIAELKMRDARKSLARYNLVWSGSFAVGPLVGSAIVILTSIRFTFFVLALLFLLTFFVDLLTLSRRRNPIIIKPATSIFEQANEKKNMKEGTVASVNKEDDNRNSDTSRNNRLLYIVMTSITGAAASIVFTFFPPLASSFKFGVLLIGVVTFAYGGARFATYIATSSGKIREKLLDKKRKEIKVYLSVFIACTSCILFTKVGYSVGFYIFAAAFVAIGFSINFAIAQSALIAEASTGKATGAGILESSIGAGGSIGPILAGALSGGSLSLPFLMPILGLILAAVFLNSRLVLVRRKRKSG